MTIQFHDKNFPKAHQLFCDAFELENAGNFQEAINLYLRAGRLGHSSSYINIGNIVMDNNMPRRRSAAFYYKKAIALGSRSAQKNLDIYLRSRQQLT